MVRATQATLFSLFWYVDDAAVAACTVTSANLLAFMLGGAAEEAIARFGPFWPTTCGLATIPCPSGHLSSW